MQLHNTITYSVPQISEHHTTKPNKISTTLLESLTSYTVDYCLEDIGGLVGSYFINKKEQLPQLVKELLYTKNNKPQCLIEDFFSISELIALQNEVQQKIQQRTSTLLEKITPGYKVEITVNSFNYEISYLTEVLTDLRITLKTFYLTKKLGDKGLEMLAEQVKLGRVKLFSDYLEDFWLEPDQIVAHGEGKLEYCLMGLVSDFEEQVTKQLTDMVVDRIYSWYDWYVNCIV